MIVFEDTHVVPGLAYSYRLRLTDPSSVQLVGETTVVVPLRLVLGLEGFRPNPAGRTAQIAFSLSSSAPATLTLCDIAGRRRFSREVGSLGPGTHLLALSGDLPSGIYLIRLTQSGHALTRKALALR